MFASELQRARVCRAIARLRAYGRPDLWTEDGPTERAVELLEQNGGTLSRGERVLLLLAWEMWDGSRSAARVSVGELVDLDDECLGIVGALFSAMAQRSVDQWLEDRERGAQAAQEP